MSNGLSVFSLDTNVLIYAYGPAGMTTRTRAIAVVTQLGTQQRGALSAQVLSEFVVTLTRKITPTLPLALQALQLWLAHQPR
jgi:predicted nucleic acid-binding protein